MTAWRVTEEGVRLRVRVQPGAKADRVEGLESAPDGGAVLRLRVTAPPADGKANTAVVKLLSKRWKLAKSDIEIVTGTTGRTKTLLLRGDPRTLAEMLSRDLSSD
jgi:hypothetical protein